MLTSQRTLGQVGKAISRGERLLMPHTIKDLNFCAFNAKNSPDSNISQHYNCEQKFKHRDNSQKLLKVFSEFHRYFGT